ncbi:unnamed protein product [Miscanthus lutarioriparius]|uniref:F-box domain-containing protein n=1 Tax=Miscanthus lutarioriparius TaxID=422564 RepID=A0A811N4Z8_9POAL|nr:unnamed protein product [Miscanthus lutarioriparius]
MPPPPSSAPRTSVLRPNLSRVPAAASATLRRLLLPRQPRLSRSDSGQAQGPRLDSHCQGTKGRAPAPVPQDARRGTGPAPETKSIQTFAPTKEEKPSSSSKDKKKEEQILQQQTEEDMISELVDDILLLILENVNLTTSVRAGVLSTRWRHLPWLLRQLSIHIKDFLREPYDHDHPAVDDIEKALSSLTEAVRSMLAPTCRKSVITKLCISFFVTSGYSNEVGHLVNEAIENGIVKDIELTCGVQMMPTTLSEEDMANHADGVIIFFRNYPNIWLQPKKDQLRSGFSNLRQLYLHDIFVGFGLMWTTTLLEAAPSLEILRVGKKYIKENNLVTFIGSGCFFRVTLITHAVLTHAVHTRHGSTATTARHGNTARHTHHSAPGSGKMENIHVR